MFKRKALCRSSFLTFVTQLLGNTFWLVLTSLQLLWKQVSSTKHYLKNSKKSVTDPFCCFRGKHPTFFFNSSDKMTKSDLLDFAIFQKRHFCTDLHKIQLDNFLPKVLYLKWHTECCMHAKIKVGHRTKASCSFYFQFAFSHPVFCAWDF